MTCLFVTVDASKVSALQPCQYIVNIAITLLNLCSTNEYSSVICDSTKLCCHPALFFQSCHDNHIFVWYAGWFYHAPEPTRRNEAQGVPLASQIPGLNDLSSIPYDDEPRPLFRETGKKIIRWRVTWLSIDNLVLKYHFSLRKMFLWLQPRLPQLNDCL